MEGSRIQGKTVRSVEPTCTAMRRIPNDVLLLRHVNESISNFHGCMNWFLTRSVRYSRALLRKPCFRIEHISR